MSKISLNLVVKIKQQNFNTTWKNSNKIRETGTFRRNFTYYGEISTLAMSF